jgi:hypothetical protein
MRQKGSPASVRTRPRPRRRHRRLFRVLSIPVPRKTRRTARFLRAREFRNSSREMPACGSPPGCAGHSRDTFFSCLRLNVEERRTREKNPRECARDRCPERGRKRVAWNANAEFLGILRNILLAGATSRPAFYARGVARPRFLPPNFSGLSEVGQVV